MKTHFLTFLLGIFVAISFAATTTNLLTVKPATPKATIVFTGYGEDDLRDKIRTNVRGGYIVKSVTIGGEYGTHCLVVMEKY